MSPSSARRPRPRLPTIVAIALLALFGASLPAAAFSSAWSKPVRIFADGGQPNHDSAVDGAGRMHVAIQDGTSGIYYATNKSGSWTTCRVSDRDDRAPSIAVDGSTVHIAFARFSDGEKGLHTAHSDQLAPAADGCGWGIVRRSSGGTGASAIGARGGVLHIAFRTATKKLKYYRGNPANHDWTVKETIDGRCCTSAPALYFTTGGAPRVAYGDGTRKAEGLKFAVRSSKGWKKSKASGGRITSLAMVLDYSPGVFTPPSNAPFIAYVVKKRGSYLGIKSSPSAKGSWSNRFLGRHFGQPGVTTGSNNTLVLLSGGGKLWSMLFRGGILSKSAISKNGKDGKPRFPAGRLTFSRKGAGVFFTHQ